MLSANYLKARLESHYDVLYTRANGRVAHELIFDLRAFKPHGITELDVAKRLMDYGFHAPTMYFPLIVDEALMIEPTETESKETMDSFIEALLAIDQEAERNPELLQHAPHTTPVSRMDEARAARKPDLRWQGGGVD